MAQRRVLQRFAGKLRIKKFTTQQIENQLTNYFF